MNTQMIIIIIAAIAVIVAFLVGFLISRRSGEKKMVRAEELANKILDEAERSAAMKKKEAVLEAKDYWLKEKSKFERETSNKRTEIQRLESRLRDKEQALNRKVDILNTKEKDIGGRERNLSTKERAIENKEVKLDNLITEQNAQLEKIAGLTSEEAKKILMENLEAEARRDAAKLIKEIKEKAEREAEKEAKNIIIQAIQRCAADYTMESCVSVVNIPNDEMKGRIIGREGRNIRSFETASGIDVIVDDTPEAIILSGYDPIRREIARLAMEKLIMDGRIHPARIEEVVVKAEKEMEVIIREIGEQACFDIGVHGINPDIVTLLGKLNYRTSYGQNVLQHSKEVAFLCGIMAAELRLDPNIAKRAGLLHDIGKAIDRETEGTHTELGVAFISKFNENAAVVNAIASHHEDVPMETPYAVMVQAADAISGARPGARRETLEGYVRRLEKLEEMADSFSGVGKAYAIQAGREIRVIAESDKIDDVTCSQLAGDIARKIEQEMEYPGQIRVTVIRETRSVEYAK